MELTILILVSVLLTISSFFLSTIGCICVFATCLALNCCYFFFLKKRREKLKELSVQLDRLLHEGTQLPISDYCEGELSILANQLQKVTLRLQEGAEQSQSDKLALAQSLALPTMGDENTRILIGPENVADELKDTSVVLASYDIGDGLRGVIGVVGPTRMDYAKVAAKLSCVADGLSKLFGQTELPPVKPDKED